MKGGSPTPVLAIGGMRPEGLTAKPIPLPPDVPPCLEAAAFVALGIDPHKFTGIAPLEAVGLGIPLTGADHVFRCDIVHAPDGILHRADPAILEGEPASNDVDEMLNLINPTLKRLYFELVRWRRGHNFIVHRGGWPFSVKAENPEHLKGLRLIDHLPRGQGDEVIRDVIESSRLSFGSGFQLWIWGGGRKPDLPHLPGTGIIIHGEAMSFKGLAVLIGCRCARRLIDVKEPHRVRRVLRDRSGFVAVDEDE